MGSKTLVRSVATGALAAAMASAGAGTAAAVPVRSDVPYTASTATAVLGDSASDFLSVVRVTAVKRSGTSLDVQLYRENWSCEVSGEPADVALSTLVSATATGTFTWTCTEDGSSGLVPAGVETGTAELRLTWDGQGQVEKAPLDHCVGRFLLRDATVTGRLELRGDDTAELTAAAYPADSYLAYDHHVCPPGINQPAP